MPTPFPYWRALSVACGLLLLTTYACKDSVPDAPPSSNLAAVDESAVCTELRRQVDFLVEEVRRRGGDINVGLEPNTTFIPAPAAIDAQKTRGLAPQSPTPSGSVTFSAAPEPTTSINASPSSDTDGKLAEFTRQLIERRQQALNCQSALVTVSPSPSSSWSPQPSASPVVTTKQDLCACGTYKSTCMLWKFVATEKKNVTMAWDKKEVCSQDLCTRMAAEAKNPAFNYNPQFVISKECGGHATCYSKTCTFNGPSGS